MKDSVGEGGGVSCATICFCLPHPALSSPAHAVRCALLTSCYTPDLAMPPQVQPV